MASKKQIAANRGGDLLLSHLSDLMWKEVLAAERGHLALRASGGAAIA